VTCHPKPEAVEVIVVVMDDRHELGHWDVLTAGDELVNTMLIIPRLAACKTKLALIPK